MKCYRCCNWPCDCSDGQTIIHGDCREVLPELGRFDLVLTDPPYGAGKADWDTFLPLDWMWLVTCGVLAVTPGVGSFLRLPEVIGSLRYKWILSAHITNGMTRGACGFGHFIPCAVYSDGASIFTQKPDACTVAITGKKNSHPSQKPYNAWKWFLDMLPGNTVLDPFLGSGTTLRAAKDLGRKCTGIELEERYCEIAANRLRQEVLCFTD